MILCLFEDDKTSSLAPLVHTRAVYDLLLGMRTMAQATHHAFGSPETVLHARQLVRTVTSQENGWPVTLPRGADVLFVNGRWIAEPGPVLERLIRAACAGEPARVFVQGEDVVAAWVPECSPFLIEEDELTLSTFDGLREERVEGARLISRLWHLLEALLPAIERDYHILTAGKNVTNREYAFIKPGAILSVAERIYTAPGSTIRPGAILNAEDGPIYVDRNALIFEGTVIRGPAYIGPYCQIRTGADIEGSSFGYYCKVGGEIHDSVLHSLSNKPHEGFLGHAYIGRWCNIGASSNNSNLKNDYGIIKLYNPVLDDFESCGLQFLGLIMGDHSKCSISTMFNTGTIVGTFCNLFGHGFHARYIPSFSWGGPEVGYSEYRIDKALKVAEAVMARRDRQLTEAERALLTAVFKKTRGEHVHK